MYFIQYCFICHPLNSIVSEDAWIEPRTVAMAVRRSNHSATSRPKVEGSWLAVSSQVPRTIDRVLKIPSGPFL